MDICDAFKFVTSEISIFYPLDYILRYYDNELAAKIFMTIFVKAYMYCILIQL